MKKIKDNIIGEYFTSYSNNGLKVIYIAKKDFKRHYAMLTTDFGSVDNHFKIDKIDIRFPDGIQHFLEHKMFEEEEIDIFQEFSKLGASANAFTSFDQTSYLFSGIDNFYKSLELLISYVQRPYFTEENVEKEMGIIEQEIKMYDDDLNWRVFFNALELMYYENPVRIDIAGTVESINTIDVDILNKAYNSFYHNDNMVLVIVGDLDEKKIISTVNKAERLFPKRAEIEKIDFNEPKNIREKEKIDKMETNIEHFAIAFKDNDYKDKDLIKRDLTINLLLELLFCESSDFFNELYTKGLVNDSLTYYYTNSKDYGHSLIIGESNKALLVRDMIIEFLKKDLDELIDTEDFERIKNNREGRFLMGLDSIEMIARYQTNFYFQDYSYEKYIKTLESIEYSDIQEIFNNHLTLDNLVSSFIKPINSQED